MSYVPAPKGYVFGTDIAREILEGGGIKPEEKRVYNLAYIISYIAKENGFKKKIGGQWYIFKNKKNQIKNLFYKLKEKKEGRKYIFEGCFNNPAFIPNKIRLQKKRLYYPETEIEIERALDILIRKDEMALFREYNWCKFKICFDKIKVEKVMNNGQDPREISNLEKEIRDYYEEIGEIKREISSAHIGFVFKVALKYYYRYLENNIPLKYFITAGNHPLIERMDHFDYRRGYKYLTYVGKWIEGEMQKCVEENNTLHVPRRHITDDEEITEMKRSARNTISLDYNGQEDNPTNNKLQERSITRKENYSKIERVIEKKMVTEETLGIVRDILSEREYDILLFYQPGKRPNEKLNIKYGLSKERIRQIRWSVLKKVKRHPEIRHLARKNQFFGNPLFR